MRHDLHRLALRDLRRRVYHSSLSTPSDGSGQFEIVIPPAERTLTECRTRVGRGVCLLANQSHRACREPQPADFRRDRWMLSMDQHPALQPHLDSRERDDAPVAVGFPLNGRPSRAITSAGMIECNSFRDA